MKTKPRLFVYKLTTDNGGAPCVHGGMLSLAICKPMIRSSAEAGDVVFGFGGKNLKERLLYIAVVTQQLKPTTYYRAKTYRHRPDCIDRWNGSRLVLRRRAHYHADGQSIRRDLGPHDQNAFVLLSRDFRYLGSKGTSRYQQHWPVLKKLVEKLRRGHRVNLNEDESAALLDLKAAVWRRYRRKKIGPPSHKDRQRSCHGDEGVACRTPE
jgi:hypothetical protein